MTSVYIRAAGAQQSWSGPRLSAHTVETLPTPTRSALTGMLAAALGYERGQWEPWLEEIQLEVRVDNPGHRLDDFQTIVPTPQLEENRIRLWKTLTAGTKQFHKGRVFDIGSVGSPVLISKHSLTGATMLIRITHPDRTEQIAAALARPVFSPFLGRKAFIPSFPFLLGVGPDDLLDTAPTMTVAAAAGTAAGVVPGVAGSVRLPVYPAGNHAEANPTRTAEVLAVPAPAWLAWWTANATLPAPEQATA